MSRRVSRGVRVEKEDRVSLVAPADARDLQSAEVRRWRTCCGPWMLCCVAYERRAEMDIAT